MSDLGYSVWLGIAPFLFGIFFYLLVFRAGKCPACGASLPRFVSPFTKTTRQWLEGGWVCPNCGADVELGKPALKWLPVVTALWGAVCLLVIIGGIILFERHVPLSPPKSREPPRMPVVDQLPVERQR